MFTSNFRLLAVALAIAGALLFLGNSSGPAANGNFYTGAPSAGGGTEGTCSTCHNNGNFGLPVINVSFSVGDSLVEMTEYVPGETYTVSVAVGHSGMAPAGYGFSSQFLNTANNPATKAGELSNPADDVRITDAASGRSYAEQSRRSQDSVFTFDWTAPAAGSGEVNYYVTANLVNGANGTGGDNGSNAPTIVTLSEGVPSGTRYLANIPHALYPNPTYGPATLRVTPPVAGEYQLKLMSIDGRFVRTRDFQLTAGSTQLEVPAQDLPAGVYAVQLVGQGSRLTSRLVIR